MEKLRDIIVTLVICSAITITLSVMVTSCQDYSNKEVQIKSEMRKQTDKNQTDLKLACINQGGSVIDISGGFHCVYGKKMDGAK